MKKLYIPSKIIGFLGLLVITFQVNAQTDNSENRRTRIEFYTQFNYNWSAEESQALGLDDFYDYTNPDNDALNSYYSILEDLNYKNGVVQVKNSAEIGLRLFKVNRGLHYGLLISLGNYSSSQLLASNSSTETAELFFSGKELRTAINGVFGAQYKNAGASLLFGGNVGFLKDYSTNLRITETNGKTTDFENDFDKFRKSDFSFNFGFELTYQINSRLILGVRYQLFDIITSDNVNTGWFDPRYNMFLVESVGLSLGYQFGSHP